LVRQYQCGGCGTGICRGDVCCELPTAPVACADAGHACGPIEFEACGQQLVFECGGCDPALTCLISEFAAVCGCAAESDAEFCGRVSAGCGKVSGTDNCGAARSNVDCGRCNDGGVIPDPNGRDGG
jgi:hypothetical protein